MSFSQYGEDLILDALTGHKGSGFYVDVGCNHPTNISNSYRFYLRGWSGIAIDANEEFASEWKRVRPNDKFYPACISDEPTEVDFKVFENRALSSIGGERFYDNDEHYRVASVRRIRTTSLTELLDDSGAPAQFDFLSIDAEGHDFNVLRSLQLERYTPKVVLLELHGTDFDIGELRKAEAVQYLHDLGYRPEAVIWTNVFFRKT